MKISICSDLHLEFADYPIENKDGAEVLILAGDICVAKDLWRNERKVFILDFFKRCSEKFKHVIYILGNHEHYHGVFFETLDIIQKELSEFKNIKVIEKDLFFIEDVMFICQTLWTDFNNENPVTIANCHSCMNDYRTIKSASHSNKNITPFLTLNQHKESVEFITTSLSKVANNRVVIVGHHAPSHKSVKPRYEHDYHVNGAYRSDLEYVMNDNPCIKLWIHGHTHEKFDYTVNQTRVICNPRGYVGYERLSQNDEPFELVTVEI